MRGEDRRERLGGRNFISLSPCPSRSCSRRRRPSGFSAVARVAEGKAAREREREREREMDFRGGVVKLRSGKQ